MKKSYLLLIVLFLCFQAKAQETCDTAIDLATLTSPYDGDTSTNTDDNLISCRNDGTAYTNTSPDQYFYIMVPSGSTLNIRQSANDYDSTVVLFYGDCTNRTEIKCFDDDDLQPVTWANDTGSDQTVYWIQDGYGSDSGSFTLEWSIIACINATATYTVVSDCANGPQFMIDVDITNLGSATSLTVTNDQGDAQATSATGVLSFGPFANGTPVVFTIANDQDAACTLTSNTLTQATCPPDCTAATPIANCGDEVMVTLVEGEGAWNPGSCGYDTLGTEFVYSFTPVETGEYSLEITAATGGYIDYFWKEASGSCDETGWTCIDDNNGAGIDPIGMLDAGVTYLFLLDSEGTGEKTATFKIKCPPTCYNGAATYTLTSDCPNGNEQFFVDVNITDMGTATSVTIADDQGSATQQTTSTGSFTFGPYPNNTNVIYTISNDNDATCVITSPAQTIIQCPPVNDEPAGAVLLTLDLGTSCGPNKITDISNASTSGSNSEVDPTCMDQYNPSNGNGDLWFYFVAPSSELTLNTSDIQGNIFSVSTALYSGTPGNFTEVGNCGNTATKAYTGLTVGETYYYRMWDYANDGIGSWSLCGWYLDCTNAAVTYDVVSDCANGEQFFATVIVNDMGSATSLTISDDQGSAPQTASAAGTYSFGPFPNNTPVIFTVANDQNPACTLTSPTQNQVACPPSNDECDAAIQVFAGSAVNEIINDLTNVGATGSPEATPTTCLGYAGGDVWYTLMVPPSGNVIIETSNSSSGDTGVDTVVTVYTGTCGNLTQIDCDDDDADTGAYSKVVITGQTPGDMLYLRIYEYNNDNAGAFGLTAYDESMLGVTGVDHSKFNAYPNPVTDILTVSYGQNITDVAVYNLLGQQVMTKKLNANTGQIDMSNISAGAYFVIVNTVDGTKTIKVLKK
ncbi:T9SS type A sorting domain-containing protein [Flavobacterium pallidum]|uniref:Uncharacterized protein n=1 Tax=Flavobacterium pallidum TaxID=2172098 RepID=A0A2S1SKM3_9FLAO|nr:T9SS type A sorting domain-containing protein [Flavobacterium pallidum]AWI26960.1 hypothetical protein HYN49_14195 [Flavobacterium pallidum]